MGKGTIVSHIGNGEYQVQVNRDRGRVAARIISVDAIITAMTAKIAAMPAGDNKIYAQLLLTSYEKEKERLENAPEDITLNAWCADATQDLTGGVGTIEVPGELPLINIQPGYGGNAVYDATRDGQLQPAIANTPFGTAFNWALFPAWQKHMPMFRYGTISNLSGDTCTVTLDEADSSEQGLDVNLLSVLDNVPIDYMYCNGSAFTNGDEVLVEFTDQDWNSPVVIGFKKEPVECAWEPWGATLTANNQWQYRFIKQSGGGTIYDCTTVGCGGEGSLSSGVLYHDFGSSGLGELTNLRMTWYSSLNGPGYTDPPIENKTKARWKIDGTFTGSTSYGIVYLILTFYDAGDNYIGQNDLILYKGSLAPTNPGDVDLTGLDPLDGSDFEYDITGLSNYDVKIGRVYFSVYEKWGGHYTGAWDYLDFD